MLSTPSSRFSTPPGAGGRLPLDRQGQPEDAPSPDCQPVQGKAHDPFRGNGSGDQPWPQHHLDTAGQGGTRDGRPFQATHLFITSLRTTPEALLQLVRDRWSIECWHWIRDTQLHEDGHRYRGSTCADWATFSDPVKPRPERAQQLMAQPCQPRRQATSGAGIAQLGCSRSRIDLVAITPWP